MRPKRRFGQNFLVNTDVQVKIMTAFDEFKADFPEHEVVEMGPGQGHLTQYLVDAKYSIKAFEVDPEAVEVLESKFEPNGNIDIILEDFYKNLSSLDLPEQFVFFSNLPFNVGSRVLVDMCLYYPQSPRFFILQKEVGKKLNMNELTMFGAWMNLYYDFKYRFDISKGAFKPMPNVTSGLVSALPRELPEYLVAVESRREVLKLLKKLFRYANKTIYNNIKDDEWLVAKFEQSEFTTVDRLTVDNYNKVLESLV